MAKPHFVEVNPKTELGKTRMEYHGKKWKLSKEADKLNFVSEPGPWLFLISLDGKKCLCVHKTNDKNFNVREL